MTIMKSFLTFLALILGVSIACSSSRSAGSPTVQNNNAATTQVSPQTESVSAQEKTPCTLTLASAPTINGLRLGMTADNVLALFPGSKEDGEVRSALSSPPSGFGESGFLIRVAKFESRDQFAGITQIRFALLDGRVSNFFVGYNGPQYPHVDRFVEKFVEGKNLPAAGQWEAYVGMDNSLKVLKCTEFEIKVFVGGKGGNLNYVDLHDLEALKKLEARKKKAEEKAAPTP